MCKSGGLVVVVVRKDSVVPGCQAMKEFLTLSFCFNVEIIGKRRTD